MPYTHRNHAVAGEDHLDRKRRVRLPRSIADAINAKTTGRVRSYFDSRDDWNLSRSLKNLIEQAIRDYDHRAVVELVQNAHDAQPQGARDGRVLIRLDHNEGEHGTLIVANTGLSFSPSNFDAICDVAQSDKRADEGIGNKGIGFKSTLQLCRIPEIYSVASSDSNTFDGYCFKFADGHDLEAAVNGDADKAADLARDVFHLCLPPVSGYLSCPLILYLKSLWATGACDAELFE